MRDSNSSGLFCDAVVDDAVMQNRDNTGIVHYPGWRLQVLKLPYTP